MTPLRMLVQPGPRGERAAASAESRYVPSPSWPTGQALAGDTASVATADDGTVWVFHRGDPPVLHLAADGTLLDSWGSGQFLRPHGISVDRYGDLYLVDELAHVVEKRSPDGTLVFRLGTPGEPAPAHSGGRFNRPTSVAIDTATGDLYVSDGYANSRIHRFDRRGEHILSWGTPGTRLGSFSLPHHIAFVDGDLLVVSDRENFRLQFFDRDGGARGLWHCHRPCAAVPFDYDGEPLLLVAELGASGIQRDVEGLGNRLVAFDGDGRERLSFERHGAGDAGALVAPHDVAVDTEGRIYVAEVATSWLRFAHDRVPDVEPASLRRWEPRSSSSPAVDPPGSNVVKV